MPEARHAAPRDGGAFRGSFRLALGSVVVLGAVLAGCLGGGATFAPTGPCLVDGRAAGAYPDLEALVPRDISGRHATSVDSGRNCSDGALGSFTSHDVHELRFAGATWDEGNGSGVSIAVLALPDQGLPVAWAQEFYEIGAANGKHTGNIETTRPTYPGVGTVYRLDTLNDLSFQSVVVWADRGVARVVIVATQVGPSASKAVHDARVAEAVGAAALAPHPSGIPGSSLGPDPTGQSSPEPVLPSPS